MARQNKCIIIIIINVPKKDRNYDAYHFNLIYFAWVNWFAFEILNSLRVRFLRDVCLLKCEEDCEVGSLTSC